MGTVVYDDETGERLVDLDVEGSRWVLEGGQGGLGNIHFKSSTNRTPRKAQPGTPGREMRLRLELKLMADVGLLGFPNAGKSTFMGRASAARPKVADYPFTTLAPSLGVVRLDDQRHFVMADIPGLIEGAAEGAGLGHQFLRHVERCACLLHLVAPDPWEDLPLDKLKALNEELKAFSSELAQRPQVVALTKVDTVDEATQAEHVKALRKATGAKVFQISSVTGEGVKELLDGLYTVVDQLGIKRRGEGEPFTVTADPERHGRAVRKGREVREDGLEDLFWDDAGAFDYVEEGTGWRQVRVYDIDEE